MTDSNLELEVPIPRYFAQPPPAEMVRAGKPNKNRNKKATDNQTDMWDSTVTRFTGGGARQ